MKKILSVITICLSIIMFTGCEQKSKVANTDTSIPSSSVSSTIEEKTTSTNKTVSSEVIVDVDKERARPVDKEVKVANPTGKINEEIQKRINNGEIVELKDGVCLDFDNDGKGEIIHFKIEGDSENWPQTYIVTVGNRQISKEAINPNGKFYGASLDNNHIQILVDADGPSSDASSDIFHYAEGQLWDIGTVYCHASQLTINKANNTFTGWKRSDMLMYWFKPVEYKVSSSYGFSINDNIKYVPPHISELPTEIYPMGFVVKLNMDLPLYLERDTKSQQITFKSGMMVSLTATDDKEWVYITPVDETTIPHDMNGGWLQMKKESFNTCLINGKEFSEDKVFTGIFRCD